MKSIALTLAKRIYRATRPQALRAFYFRLFLRLVRSRKVTTTIEGMRFELDLAELLDVGLLLEEYERDIVRATERYCRPGWVVLDIGANVGAHALRFAQCVGSEGRVFAFEPTDYAYAKLLRNMGLNQFANISAFKLALGEQNLSKYPVAFRSSWRSDNSAVAVTSLVDFRRLDDWAHEHGVERVDLIKLDVDGNEFAVLAGGHNLLTRSHPLLFLETADYHFADPATNPLALLRRLGYAFWNSRDLTPYPDPESVRAALTSRPRHSDSMNLIATAEPGSPPASAMTRSGA